MRSRILSAWLCAFATSGCVNLNVKNVDQRPLASLDLAGRRIVDLTHSFGPDTIYWPTDQQGFDLEVVSKGETGAGYWYEANRICTAEHGGTHMDAPIHFAAGQPSAAEVPVEAGIGPLVRIDVSAAAARDPDYRLSVEDLRRWEKRWGRIPPGAIVLMYSGWAARWSDRARYMGTDVPGDTANLHFPGFGEAAARFLVEERDVKAIGVDTASIDHGASTDFIVHRVVSGAGMPAFENLANLDRVPPRGATLVALPMKIEGGSGGPLRAIAILP
jgi:kynurenine formamidase